MDVSRAVGSSGVYDNLDRKGLVKLRRDYVSVIDFLECHIGECNRSVLPYIDNFIEQMGEMVIQLDKTLKKKRR